MRGDGTSCSLSMHHSFLHPAHYTGDIELVKAYGKVWLC